MCKIFCVDKSSYYHWVSNGSAVHKVDEKLNELVLYEVVKTMAQDV